ncbi:MAG: 50S ribosomal protein L15 [Alphaproteobacteria bacterium]|nr:50S ribosomal protein L15 [Alphaproteobacteria bacterium]
MKLHDLRDNPGARRKRKIIGRGIGSGVGKTSGRGGKGQTARAGSNSARFEGGQTPLWRRLPKRGFRNPNKKRWSLVNLGGLQAAIDAGRIDATKPIALEQLQAAGLVGKVRAGVRLLGDGELKSKVQLDVTHASKTARAAIEKLGGSVTTAPVAADKAEGKAEAKAQG